MKSWLLYSVIRFAVFAAAFAILMVLSVPVWLSAVLAAVLGLCVSYIFFGTLRTAVARDLAERRRTAPRDADADAEDARS